MKTDLVRSIPVPGVGGFRRSVAVASRSPSSYPKNLIWNQQPTWGSLFGSSENGRPSTFTVPLFPGGFGLAEDVPTTRPVRATADTNTSAARDLSMAPSLEVEASEPTSFPTYPLPHPGPSTIRPSEHRDDGRETRADAV